MITCVISLSLMFRFTKETFLNELPASETFMGCIGILVGYCLIITACALCFKFGIEDLFFILKWREIKVEDSKSEFVIYYNNKEIKIPTGSQTYVLFCMFGWLIIYPVDDSSYKMILLRNFWFTQRISTLYPYFENNFDLIQDKDIKKEMLKRFHVNSLIPLKYL